MSLITKKLDLLNNRILAIFSLILVTAIWGLTFVMVKDAVAKIPVMDFLAIRFAIAAIAMVILRPRALLFLDKSGWLRGALLGFVLGAGYIAQTFGLQYASAAVSGFITGMFVVFTPLIAGFILRRRVSPIAWGAVCLATIGLALISLRGFAIGTGELLTLICAFLYAVHIVGLGEWSKGRDSYALAIVQVGVVAIICIIFAIDDGITMPPDASVWWTVLITAVFASAFAFIVQTWAQSLISPTRTAIVMTMEPVFAGFFAVMIGGEVLGPRTLAGAALVIMAMYIVELGPRQAKDAEVAHLEI